MPEYDINLFLFTVCKIWGFLTILHKIIRPSLNSEGDEGGHFILRVFLCLGICDSYFHICKYFTFLQEIKKKKKESEYMVNIKVVGSSKTVVNLYHYIVYIGKCSF